MPAMLTAVRVVLLETESLVVRLAQTVVCRRSPQTGLIVVWTCAAPYGEASMVRLVEKFATPVARRAKAWRES